MCLTVTEERAAEVRGLLAAVLHWAARRPDVLAVGMAGSWACGEARADSDVDFVVLTTDKRPYLEDEAWIQELGGVRIIGTKDWGPMTERRFVLSSGLEVETGFAPPSWADVDPVDAGTRRVVTDGFRAVHDPVELLARLVDACR